MGEHFSRSASRNFAWAILIGAILSLQARGWCEGAQLVPFLSTLKSSLTSEVGLRLPARPQPSDIFRIHIFEEPLIPVGGEPSAAENRALAEALNGYAQRAGPDDFSSLTGFLEKNPNSSWSAALLTDLGLEYYNTAHYTLALDAWERAWQVGKGATEQKAKALMDRAVGELAYMYARLGRMTDLEALLKSVEQRAFTGPATERITGAREGLWNMQNRPEVSFRCGPLALQGIKLSLNPRAKGDLEILNSASTQKGFSLPQIAELSKKVGLNYQMVFRETTGAFIVPSVVHWKVGHYAAMVRRDGEKYLLQDPTFGNQVWATKGALEAETSGYFLVPKGLLTTGWREVGAQEGETVWGKGNTSFNDPRATTARDLKTSAQVCRGMAVSSVHLMLASLSLVDEPVGYSPPVGPAVRFTVRYSQRDAFQPANFTYSNLGSKWTCDWISYVTDNPSNTLADVSCYMRGGGTRTFVFDVDTQTFEYQKFDQTLLTRTGPASYEMLWGDGSKLLFTQSDGSVGTSRKIFLSNVIDPAGNFVTLTYDQDLRITSLIDAIGQVTTISYELGDAKITKVTDPFGRAASFAYDQYSRLTNITDVIGMTSAIGYFDIDVLNPNGILVNIIPTDAVTELITPYGTNTFSGTAQFNGGNTRFVETTYADGSKDRVEYNQTVPMADSEPVSNVPVGVTTLNSFLNYRNTYYWSRSSFDMAQGDYSKARLFHWLHSTDLASSSGGTLESVKAPLENRVWYDYDGQGVSPANEGISNLPTHIGRVLDDGSTQLFTYAYDLFGHLTNSVDPLGRTFRNVYATNGIDLLEARQTRVNNELMLKATYNSQHEPLAITDAAGQLTTYTYNPRGQVLTATDAKHQTISFTYDTSGYLVTVDGRLPGTNDISTLTYDAFGRVRTMTDLSGYRLTFDFDNLDRITRITYPDGTFNEYSYDRLDLAAFRDRAGRSTLFEHDSMRQVTKKTDPLGRITRFQFCRCGDIRSVTDPMGRTTSWLTDVQGRRTAKQYNDGSRVQYVYENTSSRLGQIIDERHQTTVYSYNLDNSIKSITYPDASIPTPSVDFTYDRDYARIASMTDGTGTTTYSYIPIATAPALGAGKLASIDGPLPNDTITYAYDELGRHLQTAIGGVAVINGFDAVGRVVTKTNALGSFGYAYDGGSRRRLSETFPNSQTLTHAYGDNLHDRSLERISYTIGVTPISEFTYGQDVARGTITSWSQQSSNQPPKIFKFAYDAADQLLSASVTSSGSTENAFAYSYDPAGNRLSEQAGESQSTATYNALNEISSSTAPGTSRTNEWDAVHRLTAVNVGNQRTEFSYDGVGRRVQIRQLVNGAELSRRRFVWCGDRICEERDASGSSVTKRYFAEGMKVEAGAAAGAYYYTRDHLGSIRELSDSTGQVRARYAYDPYGRRTLITGDVPADFGFAGMFWSPEAGLALTRFRAYDPELGRWLSRDPFANAEISQGPNLYAYVGNEPINRSDRDGLAPTIPGLGFNTVTASLIALEATDPDALPMFVEDLGLGAQQVGQTLVGVQPFAENTAVDLQPCFPDIVAEAVPTLTEVAPDLPEVAEEAPSLAELTMRAQELAQRYTSPDIQAELATWEELREFLPSLPSGMQQLDLEFFDLVQAWAGKYPLLNFDWHWQNIAGEVQFNPEIW